ncbi:MAG: hypothetical protein R2697_04320 [Ilumatobacteraceae bacterium]
MSHRLYGSPGTASPGLLSTFAGLAVAELMTGLVKGARHRSCPSGRRSSTWCRPG